MAPIRRTALLAFLLALALAGASPADALYTPRARTLIREGQSARYLLGGTWYFRLDDARVGLARHFQNQRSLKGWSRITVPHNWNARDTVFNRSSVGWYRKEFRAPGDVAKGVHWKVRFQSANHSVIVFLNGKKVGTHLGGYLPFEVDLKLKKGRNRLVVRVSSLRGPNDLTHWRLARFNVWGTGGWWNFGGLLREVYLRRIEGVDLEQVAALPSLPCRLCAARIRVRTLLRNFAQHKGPVHVTIKLGRKVVKTFDPVVGGRGRRRSVSTRFTIRHPKLWEPGSPKLYRLTVQAGNADGRSRYRLALGVRSITRRADGRILINYRAIRLKGASVHEDDPIVGAAWGPAQRRRALNQLRALGANVTRIHYSLHPAMMEALDRAGILFWAQAPVYQVRPEALAKPRIFRLAVDAMRQTVLANINHASAFVWSVGNELSGTRGGVSFNESQPVYQSYITAAARAARKLDRTRLIGIDRQSVIGQGEPVPAFRNLDVIGVNEYFGWYRASNGPDPSQTSDLSGFLDRVHYFYPGRAIVVSEFGAESNRHGAQADKGTFEFQNRWMLDHLRVDASKPYLSGSIVWALRDFRVHPTWEGGNPHPNPPWNNKGLIEENGSFKPAFWLVRDFFRSYR